VDADLAVAGEGEEEEDPALHIGPKRLNFAESKDDEDIDDLLSL